MEAVGIIADMLNIPQTSRVLIAFIVLLFSVAARSQTQQDFLQSFVGQKLFLRGIADQKEAKVKKKDLARLNGTCDVAVLVKQAVWNHGKARFQLEQIGTPHVPGKPPGVCNSIYGYDHGTVEISGFAADEATDSLAGSISQVLQTPEQYLAALGVPFDVKPVAAEDSKGKPPEGLNRTITAPKEVLSVDPVYSEDARRGKIQGDVVLWIVVGTDGRVHDSKVARKAGYGLDETAMNVLSLWRFEPARKQDKVVAVQMNLDLTYHLY